MIRDVTYTTSSGATDNGTTFRLSSIDDGNGLLWSNDLAKWGFDISKKSNVTSRSSITYKANAVMTPEQCDAFLLMLDKDSANGLSGTLSVDGWELTCNAKAGEVKRYGGGLLTVQLQLYSADTVWRRHTTYSLEPDSGSSSITTGLDYPTDFPYDYAGTSRSTDVVSFESSTEFLVRLIFFGPCANPYARVSCTNGNKVTSNLYGVNASASANERIVVDPMNRRTVGSSVYKVGAYGERENLYSKRVRGAENSGTYVFQRMPAGQVSVSWPQEFGLFVDLIEERGMLPWT